MADLFVGDDHGGANEEDGFDGYQVSTVDPGPWLLVGSILISVSLYAVLPCLLRLWPPPSVSHTGQSDTRERNVETMPRSREASEAGDSQNASATETTHQPDREYEDGFREPSADAEILSETTQNPDSSDTSLDKPLGPYERLLEVAEWDAESRRLYRLALAFGADALVVGVLENARVAILGHLVSTPALSAYVLVALLVGLTSDFVGGFYRSLATLLSHSIGTAHARLTGQYVQLAIWLFVGFSVPFIVMWFCIMDRTLLFLGLDAPTAQIGQDFTVPYALAQLIRGIHKCFRYLMETSDYAVTSTVIGVVEEVVSTTSILIYALFWDNPSLSVIGYIFLVVSLLGLVGTLVLIAVKGWFKQYYTGLFGSLALKNWHAMKMMFHTSIPISCGYLLSYGEWEILTFFAAFLGPAELVTWGLLGTVWDVLEDVTQAVADAAEIRCATLLGSGKPEHARASAYKSILIAFVFSTVLTSFIFLCSDDLPKWLTSDETLQVLLFQLIPLFGVGNITLTMGTMAWTLVGSQGRYRLATAVGVAGSWFVTIPLSVVFTIVLRINLEGQTAAVVMGYMMSGVVNIMILLRSDWRGLSDAVIEYNQKHDIELSSDDEEDVSGEDGSEDDEDDAESSSSVSSPTENQNEQPRPLLPKRQSL